MEQTAPPKALTDAPPAPRLLSRVQLVVLCLVLTVALIPFFSLVRYLSLEVSQYHVTTFEAYARDALARGDYNGALGFCKGAMTTGVNRSDHWGKVLGIRAQAYTGMEDFEEALNHFEAGAAFYTRRDFYATDQSRREFEEFGVELARQFLDKSKSEEALRALSAAAVGSQRPVEYLHELQEILTPGERAALWPAEPYVVVQDYRGSDLENFERDLGEEPFEGVVNEQERELRAAKFEEAEATGRSGLLDLGPSTAEGRCFFGTRVHLPLSEDACALRVFLREDTPSDVKLTVSYWFDLERQSATTTDVPTATLDDGCKQFDIERDFYAERLDYATQVGYDITGGVIDKIGLEVPPGPANRYWVDRIELYLPKAAS